MTSDIIQQGRKDVQPASRSADDLKSPQTPDLEPVQTGERVPERVYRYIVQTIEQGVLKPGQELPSEYKLAESLNVSRLSLREALQKLQLEGYVERRRGVGTFVKGPRPLGSESGFEALYSFSYHALSEGKSPATKLFSVESEPASREVAQALGILEGEPLSLLKRLRTVDGVPMQWNCDRLAAKLLPPGTKARDVGHSLYEFLEVRHGISVVHARATIHPVVADETTSIHLAVPIGSPLLKIVQVHYDEEDRPVLHSTGILPPDRDLVVVHRSRQRR